MEQLRDFPNGDHDDGPDALEMAIRLANEMLYQESWEIVTRRENEHRLKPIVFSSAARPVLSE